MHGVRVELLENQAKSIGLLEIMQIRNAKHGSLWKRDADYTGKIKKSRRNPIFLEILTSKTYVNTGRQISDYGTWRRFSTLEVPTYDLIQEFIALGFKTIVVCVNERYLDKSFIGRVIDQISSTTYLKM
jgi:diphthamide synthase (EF-2-diphthine--ammonia ligase)